MKPTVLIIDDDEAVLDQLKWALADEYEVLLAKDRSSAIETFRARRPDLALLDLGLPPLPNDPREGMAALADMRNLDRHTKVIVISGLSGKETAARAVGEGACDFLLKPVQIDSLKLLLSHCRHVVALEREYEEIRQHPEAEPFELLQSRSPRMEELLVNIRKVATTEAPVLILGESGTGKDVVALAIHRQSALRAGPFVKLNCDMASESLLESELFGREDDAQSDGASAEGRLESASGGSLFLQDVGDLPLRSQVRLMRLLEERVADGVKERPSGEIAPRLIAASSKDLTAAIAKGSFLEGLYYRLAVLVIRVPALRDRKEDIRQLAEGFLKRFAAQFDRPNLQFDSEALRALERHAWPGNLRELENCVRRAAIMSDTDILRADDLGLTPSTVQPAAAGLREARQSAERAVIIGALRKHHGKITAASMELGISRPTFYSLMEKLGIERRSLIWDHSEETSEE